MSFDQFISAIDIFKYTSSIDISMSTLLLRPSNSAIAILYRNHPGLRHSGDAGIDLYIPTDIVVPANARAFVLDHEISCAMTRGNNPETPADECLCSYYLYPRSSIAKTPLRMANCIGIIDSGYRGSIMALVDNLSDQPYPVTAGTRLFQICSPTLDKLALCFEIELPVSSRGNGGIGSTGK